MPDAVGWYFGGGFGVWTVMDGNMKCQLWSTLFFAHSFEPALHTAQFFSLLAMLTGLALVAILTQILPCRWVNWLAMLGFVLWTTDSYSYLLRYSLWSTFYALTYILFVAASRHLFRSVYSIMVQRRVVRVLLGVATLSSLGILLMVGSNVCSCSYIHQILSAGIFDPESALEHDTAVLHPIDEEDLGHCEDSCQLLESAQVAAPVLWAGCWLVFPYCRIHTATAANIHENKSEGAAAVQEPVALRETACEVDRSSFDDSLEDIDLSAVDQSEDEWTEPEERPKSYEHETGTETNRLEDLTVVSTTDEPAEHDTIFVRACRYADKIVLTILILVYLFVLVVMIGAFMENAASASAPDTSHNFLTESVCGFNPLDPTATYETFANKTEAANAGFEVVHCGECARCSNPSDISVYVNTRTTVAKSAKMCSKTAVFGKYDELMDCLEEEIGFSRPCTECWADNMKSTAKSCLFTCLSSMLTGNTQSNNQDHADDYNWLNQCIYCDEKRSGPAFVQCSGVARRRLGIESEIERNPAEQCQSVDVDYVDATSPHFFFNYYK
jgi:hypothetical protein